ncbi:hypothetical protein OIU85_002856 [Salix viminalis]|uniref:Uncharacterized protein n=1 Tax=Salix viminalis TaxID=40686 RepID=A0A9Q0VPZ0_SALVM|nr:hypothetical protein OIU85_002856 [Salix viminalis]
MHAWKQLKEVVLHESFLGFNPVVSACGSLHWLTFGCKMFAFHVKEETYSMISLPEAVRKNHHRKARDARAALRNRINNLTLFNLKDGSSKSLRLEMGFDVVETFSFRSDFEHTKFWMNLWWRTQEETKNKRVETKKVFHD